MISTFFWACSVYFGLYLGWNQAILYYLERKTDLKKDVSDRIYSVDCTLG